MELVSRLTEAQKEVLLLKLKRKTNQEIAKMRNVTLTTVESGGKYCNSVGFKSCRPDHKKTLI